MDYYEELGLRPSASAEEIRAAYRQLARVLHPDSQQEPEVRRLAEIQMARLNEIADILLNPGRRRVYDRGLTASPVAMIVPVLRVAERRGLGRWAGAGAVGAAAGLCWLGWFWMGEWEGRWGPGVVERSAGEEARNAGSKAGMAGLEARSTSGAKRPERKRAKAERREKEQGRGEDTARREVETGKIGDTGALAVAVRPETEVERPTRTAAPRAGMAGSWFYVPGRDGQGDMKYAAEYIELTLRETGGQISGRYRGRYRVPDLAVSPEVAFELNAVAGEEGAAGSWTAAGGAAGRIDMKVIGLEQMQVRWWATENGAMNLVSGIATLVRRREP